MRQHIGGLRAFAFAGARREHEFVVQKMQGRDFRILDRKRNENEIEITTDQLPDQGFGDGLAEVQVKSGKRRCSSGSATGSR